jgi:hypothetical protein
VTTPCSASHTKYLGLGAQFVQGPWRLPAALQHLQRPDSCDCIIIMHHHISIICHIQALLGSQAGCLQHASAHSCGCASPSIPLKGNSIHPLARTCWLSSCFLCNNMAHNRCAPCSGNLTAGVLQRRPVTAGLSAAEYHLLALLATVPHKLYNPSCLPCT